MTETPHTASSVKELLRGPLLHTPQGIVAVLFSVVYLLVAGFAVLFGDDWLPRGGVPLCVAWPFLLFIYFIRDNAPAFAPSWGSAAWLAFYAVLPVLFEIYDRWFAWCLQ